MTERRYPLARLVEATGLTEYALASMVGIDGTTLKRARERGLVTTAADRCAARAGFVVWHVWPEWLDHQIEDCSVPCAGCGTPFVPSRKSNIYCGSAECERARHAKRERDRRRRKYATDPEWREKVLTEAREFKRVNKRANAAQVKAWREANRERERARSRRYFEENRERELARRRRYYLANRDRLLAKQRERDQAKRDARAAA